MPSPDWPPLPEDALSESFLAGTGPGGQNVNKVATAVQLRLDVFALRLPMAVFLRLKELAGSRWTKEGEIVITAREHRSREANREEARARLAELVGKAHLLPAKRVKTRPGKAAREKRMVGKAVRAVVKRGRGKVEPD
ncbi:MAG: alternative ribosome rescue aminoacyl-tRNA hydrolase ArfB [Sphingomonadaceae bacterium]